MAQDNYYCKAPWHGLNYTPFGLAPCCFITPFSASGQYRDYLDSDELTQLQLEHSDPKHHPLRGDCVSCIQGGENTAYVEFNYACPPEALHSGLRVLSIGNDVHCGLECVMCYSNHKKFETLEKAGDEHLGYEVPKPDMSLASSSDVVTTVKSNLETLESVTFLGGDPSMNEDVPEILRLLKGRNIKVRYYHNSHRLKLKDGTSLIEALQGLKRPHVILSHDGPGLVGEYQRYGFKQSRFDEHLRKLSQALGRSQIEILFTLTNLNVLRLEETLNYYQTLLDSWLISTVSVNGVIKTNWNSPNCLPYKLKRQVLQDIKRLRTQYTHPRLLEFLDQCESCLISNVARRSDWDKFVLDTVKIDKVHGTNVLDVLPEFSSYWPILTMD